MSERFSLRPQPIPAAIWITAAFLALISASTIASFELYPPSCNLALLDLAASGDSAKPLVVAMGASELDTALDGTSRIDLSADGGRFRFVQLYRPGATLNRLPSEIEAVRKLRPELIVVTDRALTYNSRVPSLLQRFAPASLRIRLEEKVKTFLLAWHTPPQRICQRQPWAATTRRDTGVALDQLLSAENLARHRPDASNPNTRLIEDLSAAAPVLIVSLPYNPDVMRKNAAILSANASALQAFAKSNRRIAYRDIDLTLDSTDFVDKVHYSASIRAKLSRAIDDAILSSLLEFRSRGAGR